MVIFYQRKSSGVMDNEQGYREMEVYLDAMSRSVYNTNKEGLISRLVALGLREADYMEYMLHTLRNVVAYNEVDNCVCAYYDVALDEQVHKAALAIETPKESEEGNG